MLKPKQHNDPDEIINNVKMKIYDKAKISKVDSTVLILSETGVGKTLIHIRIASATEARCLLKLTAVRT